MLTDAQLLLDQSLQHVSNQMRVLHGKDRAALQIEWLELIYQPSGFGAVSFITTRVFLSATFALLISIFLGQRIIQWLQKMQLGETLREDVGLDHHLSKRGTPTMGGLIIILATVVPTLL